jgi:DNA-damage-inducible protein J
MSQGTIRMDEGLIKRSEAMFEEMGLSTTAVRENRIPFEIRVDPFFSETNQRRLREAAADMDARRNIAVHDLIEEDDDD